MSPEKQVIISQTDSEIADIIASQPTEITVREKKGFNPFYLPEECKEYEDKKIFRYRWISKDKRMLPRARYKGWLICNSINSSYLPKELFGVHGGVERLGHLLAFMPVKMAEEIRKEASDKSTEAVKYYTKGIKEKDPRFYEAKLGENESDTDDKSAGLVQGRDF